MRYQRSEMEIGMGGLRRERMGGEKVLSDGLKV